MTTIEVLNTSLEKVAELKNLYPINEMGMILRYSDELSDHGYCTFRIATKDPMLTQYGDILVPHKNHIRIKRFKKTVWQGAIVDNTERNKNYIEVRAAQYEYYLDKKIIRQDTTAPTGADTSTDSWKHYRTFLSGTMSSNVTTLMNQAITDWGNNHILGDMTLDTIENPNYPEGFKNSSGASIAGKPWSFNDFITLRFDYHSVAYVLEAFGIYTNADYYIDNDLAFHFKKFVGNKQTDITFEYGVRGNIVDYNLPRLGGRMTNSITGIAADEDGTVLHAKLDDPGAISEYGLLEQATGFGDVKTQNELKKRLRETLQFVKTPEDAPVNVVLNEKSYPFGQYGVGDIVTIIINDHNISFNKPRRIVGITVTLHNTGREMITIQTNKPNDQYIGG